MADGIRSIAPLGSAPVAPRPDTTSEGPALNIRPLSELVSQTEKVEKAPPATMGEALSRVPNSFVPSAIKFAEDMVQPILHPLDTAESVARLVYGVADLAMGDDTPDAQLAAMVGKHYADRYGSMAGFRKAVAEDPVGLLSDLSLPLTGGAMLAGKGAAVTGRAATVPGAVGKTARAAQTGLTAAQNVLHYADPVNATVGAATTLGKGAIKTSGYLSGASPRAVEKVYGDARAGDATAAKNMRGQADSTQVLDDMELGIRNLRRDMNAQYKRDMAPITSDPTVIGPVEWGKIDDAVRSATELGEYRGVSGTAKPISTDPKAEGVVAEMRNKIEEWQLADPYEFHTPEGLDRLKRALYQISKGVNPLENKPAVAASTAISKAVRAAINDIVPDYARVMKNYEEAADYLDDIQATMSHTAKATDDTKMRKAQSVMRDNANTNWGERVKIIEALEAASGKNIQGALAGQATSAWHPRGIAGPIATGTLATLASTMGSVPAGLALLPATIPRVVGETANAAGLSARQLASIRDALGITKSGVAQSQGAVRAAAEVDEERQKIDDTLEDLADTPQKYADGGMVEDTGSDFAGDLGVQVVELKHGGPVNPKKPSPKATLTREQLMEAIKALAASGVLPKRKFAEGGFAQSYNNISDPNKYLNYGSTPFSQFTQTAMETPAQMARTDTAPSAQPSFTEQAPALTQGALTGKSGALDVGAIGDPAGANTAAGPASTSASGTANGPGNTGPGGFSWGQVGNAVGTGLSAATTAGGLGLVGGALGTAFDVSQANQTVDYANAQPGLNAEKLGFMDYLDALAHTFTGGLFNNTSAKDQAYNNVFDAVGKLGFVGPTEDRLNLNAEYDEAMAEQDAQQTGEMAPGEQEANDAASGGAEGGGTAGGFGGQEGDTGFGESGDGYARGGRAKKPAYMTAGAC